MRRLGFQIFQLHFCPVERTGDVPSTFVYINEDNHDLNELIALTAR